MPKGGGKRTKREPVEAVKDEEPEAALAVEFPVHAIDGYEVPLVCRDASEYYSVMGVLFWSHYNSLEAGIMRFFDTKEACVLRLVHSEFRDAVSATPWHDLRTVIKGSVASWRECFGLRAQAASVYERENLVDADFVHFRGLAALDMNLSAGFSDAAYANLRGIGCLSMDLCAFGVGAISHLKGVQEIGMWGLDLAVVKAAKEHLQGVRSMKLSKEQNPIWHAIGTGDVAECRRLLAARCIGSECWLYAGVTFHEVSALVTSNEVIAAACVQLLQVGIDMESASIIWEAAFAICDFTVFTDEARIRGCLILGVVAALVAALNVSACWTDSCACTTVSVALANLAMTDMGRDACLASNATRAIVESFKVHLDLPVTCMRFYEAFCNLSRSRKGTASIVSSGGVHPIVASLRTHIGDADVCEGASVALCAISGFADGVAACLHAVPHLLAAYNRHPRAREHAKVALRNLGVEVW